jgi:uncharacterized RDD family membrane protein YckC
MQNRNVVCEVIFSARIGVRRGIGSEYHALPNDVAQAESARIGMMREKTARSGRWKTCFSCGQNNGYWETRCQKCGRRLSVGGSTSTPFSVAFDIAHPNTNVVNSQRNPKNQKAAPPPAFPDHVRRQLQDRVQRYRSRKEQGTPVLPFEDEPEPSPKVISFPDSPAEEKVRAVPAPPQRVALCAKSHHPEPAASVPQPSLDFHTGALPDQVWRSRPVAPIRLRAVAHLKDLQLIAGAELLFLAALLLIPYLGVAAAPLVGLLAGIACGSLLLVFLYAFLFVFGSGVTPGMKQTGLRLVTFDGLPAPRSRRFWRILGGVVSAGSFLIGFLWAAADEERLYWHDHISKTYLTLSDS